MQELIKLKRELEEKEKALQEAQRKLQELDEAKTRFMMLVNHELRTPLTGITSFLDLLQETPLNDEQKLFVTHIDKNTQQLRQIITDILELISAQTGLTEVNAVDLISHDIIEDTLLAFKTEIQKKSLKVAIENSPLKIQADPSLLKKVLFKLTDNAVKFAKNESLIRIATSESKSGVKFTIENQGSIDDGKIQEVLEPFVLDEKTMNHSQGLGLGLSISNALLKRHESQLHIQSENNKVQVSFLLPLSERSEKARTPN